MAPDKVVVFLEAPFVPVLKLVSLQHEGLVAPVNQNVVVNILDGLLRDFSKAMDGNLLHKRMGLHVLNAFFLMMLGQ